MCLRHLTSIVYLFFCHLVLCSGQETGPITWEMPAALDTSGKGKSIISTERCMLSDNFSALNCRNIVEIDASYLDWSDSQLLHKVSCELVHLHGPSNSIFVQVVFYAFMMVYLCC